MQKYIYYNVFSKVHIRGLNNISQDYDQYYLRNNKDILNLKDRYNKFKLLINHNKILNIKDRFYL